MTECIREGILEEFLRKNRAEVIRMSILFDFDEEKYMRMMREEYREEYREKGREEGRKEGREEGKREGIGEIVNHMFEENRTPDEVSKLTGQPIDYVRELHEEYISRIHKEEKVLY